VFPTCDIGDHFIPVLGVTNKYFFKLCVPHTPSTELHFTAFTWVVFAFRSVHCRRLVFARSRTWTTCAVFIFIDLRLDKLQTRVCNSSKKAEKERGNSKKAIVTFALLFAYPFTSTQPLSY